MTAIIQICQYTGFNLNALNAFSLRMWQPIAYEAGVGTTSSSRARIMEIISSKHLHYRLASFRALGELNRGM